MSDVTKHTFHVNTRRMLAIASLICNNTQSNKNKIHVRVYADLLSVNSYYPHSAACMCVSQSADGGSSFIM